MNSKPSTALRGEGNEMILIKMTGIVLQELGTTEELLKNLVAKPMMM